MPDRPTLNPTAEEAGFQAAIATVERELREASDRLAPYLPPTEQALFTVYRMMLGSDSLLGETRAGIQAGQWASAAWRDVAAGPVRLLEQAADPYLSARAEDIRAIWADGCSITCALPIQPTPIVAGERWVLVAEEMSVAHLAAIPTRAVGLPLSACVVQPCPMLRRWRGQWAFRRSWGWATGHWAALRAARTMAIRAGST